MTFAGPPLLGSMGSSLPVPVFGDPDLALYAALGSTQGSWWRTLGPRVVLHGLRLALRGRLPKSAQGQDVRQLGGVAIVDARCRLQWLRVQRDPADYPSVTQIADAVRTTASTH